MAITQMQIIQSLGEAMRWFEREQSWDVPATELRHLCGRIGELYAALITNGQMATEVNQKGYDVVSSDGERISVKTTAKMTTGGHISFNPSTLDQVDRVIILRINTEEMQVEILLDQPIQEAIKLFGPVRKGKRTISLSKLKTKKIKPREYIKVIKEVEFDGQTIRELETGTIEVEVEGSLISPVKPVLRKIAKALNISLLNSSGNKFNTRQLGSQVIGAVSELNG